MAEADPDSGAAGSRASRFAGAGDDAWSLERAVDALAASARAAGRPGWIWVAGIAYPTVGIGIALGVLNSRVAVGTSDLSGAMGEEAAGMILFLPLALLVFRLQVGLARIAPQAIWERLSETFGRPKLRQAWRAGSGLTWASGGMWLMLQVMQGLVLALVAVPVVQLSQGAMENLGDGLGAVIWVVVVMPLALVLALYSVLLSILHQLALQSLAHNRRGVSSALLHAWRLAKHDPWGTARTVGVDLMLDLSIWVLNAIVLTVGALVPVVGGLAGVVSLVLFGFAGVTRAGYWARAYRALGGLSPDDGIPGLPDVGEPLA